MQKIIREVKIELKNRNYSFIHTYVFFLRAITGGYFFHEDTREISGKCR